MARIVLNTFGSFGDLHPYLAVAIELKRRGHDPVLATAELYRSKIEAEGVNFAAVRPNVGELLDQQEFVRKLWHPRRGTEFLIRDYVMPAVENSYEDLLPICTNADLLITHFATFAAPVVAERLHLPWLSVALQPAVFLSRYDPPVLAPAPWLRSFRMFGPAAMGAVLQFGANHTRSWSEPVAKLRRREGLPPAKTNPLAEGQFSPFGTLAWFSRQFAQPQADWPANTTVTGFAYYDKLGAGFSKPGRPTKEMDALRGFLEAGPPPVLFTLGSSAVMQPGIFYQESLAAVRKLGVRAILLAGVSAPDVFGSKLPASVHVASYAPYSEIMPRCAATVHQGGIGTTAQALRAARPMIVVPWSHDQPDNAHRIQRMGVGRTIPRDRYNGTRAAHDLEQILTRETYARQAELVGAAIDKENGTAAACDAIHSFTQGKVKLDSEPEA